MSYVSLAAMEFISSRISTDIIHNDHAYTINRPNRGFFIKTGFTTHKPSNNAAIKFGKLPVKICSKWVVLNAGLKTVLLIKISPNSNKARIRFVLKIFLTDFISILSFIHGQFLLWFWFYQINGINLYLTFFIYKSYPFNPLWSSFSS